MVTGRGLLVLDIDVKGEGEKSLRLLLFGYGLELPETPSVNTGGGGRHLYFRGDGRKRIRFRDGLDLVGRGGYVVAPPSLHPSGQRYTWDRAPGEVDFAAAPRWLLRLVDQKRSSSTTRVPKPQVPGPAQEPAQEPMPAPARGSLSRRQVAEQAGVIPEGYRHNALLRHASRLRRGGASEAELLGELLALNQSRCSPPLEEAEVRDIARWMARQPSFLQAMKELYVAWEHPGPGPRGMARWKVAQALLHIGWRARSTEVAPGLRRLELRSLVSRKTLAAVLRSLVDSGQLEPLGSPAQWQPQAWRLRPVPLSDMSVSTIAHRLHHLDEGDMAEELNTWKHMYRDLAFWGRESALRVFMELDTDRLVPSRLIAARTGLSLRAVQDNLSWLESLEEPEHGIPWVFRTHRREWLAGFEPTEEDYMYLAEMRGTVERWHQLYERWIADDARFHPRDPRSLKIARRWR